MEAILWKLRTGAAWCDIPEDLCPWKTAYNRFNRWAMKGLWDKFFLNYEAYWIQNGYSSTEAAFALINMQVELGLVKVEQLAPHEVEQLQKSTWPSTRMDIRLILKSLGVKSTTVKLHRNWLTWLNLLTIWLQIRAMTLNAFEKWQGINRWPQSFQEGQIVTKKTENLTLIFIGLGIWLKTCLLAWNTSGALPLDLTSWHGITKPCYE